MFFFTHPFSLSLSVYLIVSVLLYFPLNLIMSIKIVLVLSFVALCHSAVHFIQICKHIMLFVGWIKLTSSFHFHPFPRSPFNYMCTYYVCTYLYLVLLLFLFSWVWNSHHATATTYELSVWKKSFFFIRLPFRKSHKRSCFALCHHGNVHNMHSFHFIS